MNNINEAKKLIESCRVPWPTISELASMSKMSESHFHARFRSKFGISPSRYQHLCLLSRAKDMTGIPRTAVARKLGYYSLQHFCAACNRYKTVAPELKPTARLTFETFVYFIGPKNNDGPIKIGHSVSPKQRLASLQIGSHHELRILLELSGGSELEKEIHERFATEHIKGEWFRPSARVLCFIEEQQRFLIDAEKVLV